MTDGSVHLLYNSSCMDIPSNCNWAALVRATCTVQKRQAVRSVHRVQNHTCRITLLQTAGRAAVLGEPSSLWTNWSRGRLRFIEYKPPKSATTFHGQQRYSFSTQPRLSFTEITGSLAGIFKLGIYSIAFFRPSHHTLSYTFLLWQLTKSIMAFFLFVLLSLFQPRYVVTKSLH
jgi:hypothetical protein